ncbi:MAG: phosphatase [Gammaproteobacteria bacterium]|nr:MAG: phosphatase [Gammaproteobacteria bacterium]
MIADLHCHSNISDGILSPTELVQVAKKNSIDLLSLTDHDSVDGLKEAKKIADKLNIQFLTGIEISTIWQKKPIHIVGLNFNPDDRIMQEGLKKLINSRQNRAIKIAKKIENLGLSGVLERVSILAGNKNISRTHFATYLIEQKKCNTMQEAFDKYLADNKRCCVPLLSVDLSDAVGWIKNAGGVAVVAHPMRYKMTMSWLNHLCQDFKNLGGDGIEVISGRTNEQDIKTATNLCVDYDFKASIGSDFHNPKNKFVYLGMNKKLPKKLTPIWQDML